MIGNKIADKIISLGKTKNKEKEDERQETQTAPEKRQQIIGDLTLYAINVQWSKFALYNVTLEFHALR